MFFRHDRIYLEVFSCFENQSLLNGNMKEDKQTKSLKVYDNEINTTKIEHLAERVPCYNLLFSGWGKSRIWL